MVKFQKQLSQQLVPEWTDAYCNYKLLKQQIKKIKQHHHPGIKSSDVAIAVLGWNDLEGGDTNHMSANERTAGSPLAAAAVTGLASLTSNVFKQPAPGDSIQVHRRESDTESPGYYETDILEPCIAAAEHEKIFFKKLDEQLNTVDSFYMRKEGEYIIRAYQLHTQIETLFEMQNALARCHRVSHLSPSDSDESPDELETSTDIQIPPAAGKGCRGDAMISVCEKSKLDYFSFDSRGVKSQEQSNLDFSGQLNGNKYCKGGLVGGDKFSDTNQFTSLPMSNRLSSSHPVSRDLVVNVSVATPLETISAVSRILWEELTRNPKRRLQSIDENREESVKHIISKRQVKNAEKMLRAAFMEFYRGLTLLASFSSLNRQAFEKILKKYDKVTARHTSDTYLRAIETSHFAGSDKVVKLMDRVEGIFTEHFTKKNQREAAMAYLKPTREKISHSITFLTGLFFGCSLALFMAYLLILKLADQWKTDMQEYIKEVFPIFSALALLLLHLYLYGCNVHLWQRVRINYAFIFEFAPGTELRSREVLLVSTGLTTVLTVGMVAQVVTYSKCFKNLHVDSDIVPLFMTMVFLCFLFMPLNVFYKSSRRSFLRCLMRVVLSPFFKVVLADFFLADQITSQVTNLRNLEYAGCYLVAYVLRKPCPGKACTGSPVFWPFQYIVSILPYWWRIMQCLRRWIDERDLAHIANGGKYLSALVAVVMRVKYTSCCSEKAATPFSPAPSLAPSACDTPCRLSFVLFIVSSVIATVYQLYWDIVVDWGLLQRKSANPWLRDQLILKRKYIYFLSMALNVVLRLAWIYTVIIPPKDGLSRNTLDLTFAALEVIRRGHWNFYRLENEHLNNVGKFRAVKQVPLPFKHTIRRE